MGKEEDKEAEEAVKECESSKEELKKLEGEEKEKAKEMSEKDKLKEEHKRAAKKAEVKKDQLFKLFATVCKKDVDVALEKRATEKKEVRCFQNAREGSQDARS